MVPMKTESNLVKAQKAAALCEQWTRLKVENHLSGNQAAKALGRSPVWFCRWWKRYQSEGVAAFQRERGELGAARRLFRDLPPWFMPLAKFFYLNTNLHRTRGSIQEAIRRTVMLPKVPPAVQARVANICRDAGWQPVNGEKLPTCPPDLRERILARGRERKRLLPESLADQIAVAAPFVKHHRNKRDAALDYISGHGTQMWQDGDDGEKHFIQSGDVVECDDATINFPVCIPWEIRGDPCSETWGVKVGRFQWLVAIDAGSRKVLAFTYTARPRSSYRGEDVLSLMKAVVRQHGIPRAWRLEKGVWASNLVSNAVEMMAAKRIGVHNPHSKPFIEGLFNSLWTKLSVHFPEASVGRFRGEGEEANRLLTACQDGAQDPRPHFPILSDVIAAFEEVIQEHNSHLVDSSNYGRWVPDERWQNDIRNRPLRRLPAESEFLFAPFCRVWTVRGNSIGGKVPLFDTVGVPFNWSADWLLHFHGARCRCHFDPNEPGCKATIVLDQTAGAHRAGEVLGVAAQSNATAEYIQSVLGRGDKDRGLEELRQASTALRRVVRGIQGGPVEKESIEGKYEAFEARDGLGGVSKIVRGTESTGDEVAPSPIPALIPVDFTTRNGKIARLPLAVRQELNERLRNGEVGKNLVEWLNGLESVREILSREFRASPISPQNLSEWKTRGYLVWLRAQSTIESRQEKPENPRTVLEGVNIPKSERFEMPERG
jgi:hypothetical protein